MPGTGSDTVLRWVARISLAALLGIAAFVVLSTVVFAAAGLYTGPAGDYWFWVPDLRAMFEGGDRFHALSRMEGGHHLVLTKLLCLAEYRWFGGRNIFLLVCGLALQALNAILLIAWVRAHRDELAAPGVLFLSAMIATLLFSATQIENFHRGWSHYFTAPGGTLVGLIAVWQAGRAVGWRRAGWLALAVTGATAATYSMANGLLAWPLLLAVALRLRLPAAALAGLAAAAALLGGAFFIDYPPLGAGLATETLARPFYFTRWAMGVLGSPLAWTHRVSGELMGTAGALAALGLCARAFLRRSEPRPLELVLAGLALFSLASVLLVSMGRASLSPDYVSGAATRYQSTALFFWAALLGLLWIALSRRPGSSAIRVALLVGALAWTSAVLLPAHLRQAERMAQRTEVYRIAHFALLADVFDHRFTGNVSANVGGAEKWGLARPSAFLREHRLGPFADGMHELLGKRVGRDLAVQRGANCAGELLNLMVLKVPGKPPHVKLVGTIAGADGLTARAVLLSDPAGEVVGLGGRRRRAYDPGRTSFEAAGWVAFTGRVALGTPVTAWALLDDDRICRVTGPTEAEHGFRSKQRGSREKPRNRGRRR